MLIYQYYVMATITRNINELNEEKKMQKNTSERKRNKKNAANKLRIGNISYK